MRGVSGPRVPTRPTWSAVLEYDDLEGGGCSVRLRQAGRSGRVCDCH